MTATASQNTITPSHKTRFIWFVSQQGACRTWGRQHLAGDLWPTDEGPSTSAGQRTKLILTEDYLFRLVGKFIWLGPERLQSSSRYDREYMTITTVKLDTIWHWQNISTLLSNIKLLAVNEISLSAVPCIFQAVWNYNKYNDSLKFGCRKKFNKIENKSETMFIILSWQCKSYFLRFCSQVTISLGRSLK